MFQSFSLLLGYNGMGSSCLHKKVYEMLAATWSVDSESMVDALAEDSA